MLNPLVEVRTVRERAEREEKAGRLAEAAAAYDALAKAWLKASGLAATAGEGKRRLELAEEARAKAAGIRSKAAPPSSCGGGRMVADRRNGGNGAGCDQTVRADGVAGEDPGPCEPLEDLLAQLDSLVGLEGVKRQVHDMIDVIATRRKREAKGLKNPDMSYHLVFTGSPGTGKTTVARLVAKLYRSMGLLRKGQLVETDREGLVSGFVGQTAIKTKEVVERALGGVLFIDEAYAISPKNSSGSDFGPEAIATLLKAMEDNRDNLVVIAAGYSDEMDYFINHTNPGLPSRFSTTIDFEDYSADELAKIFRLIALKSDYEPSEECLDAVLGHYEGVLSDPPKGFANARDARNLFEKAVVNQAKRLSAVAEPTEAQMKTLDVDDLPPEYR